VRKFPHLCRIVDLAIIQTTKNFFKVTFIVEFEGGSVGVFATNSKEKVSLWIPSHPLLCCNLIECNHCTENTDPALDDIQVIRKCGADVGGNLEDCWLCMGRDNGRREGYPPQVCETWIISGTMS
jgi:hypothetical protein